MLHLHVCPKTPPSYYFFNNSVKIKSIFITSVHKMPTKFDARDYAFVHFTWKCEMQNSFIWGNYYRPQPKIECIWKQQVVIKWIIKPTAYVTLPHTVTYFCTSDWGTCTGVCPSGHATGFISLLLGSGSRATDLREVRQFYDVVKAKKYRILKEAAAVDKQKHLLNSKLRCKAASGG